MKKLLVIDDEQHLREGVAQAFRERGWDVREAGDGAEAIKIMEDDVFDVIVTDERMPHKSGMDVLRHAKMIHENSAVLVMTAYGTIETAIEAMRQGANDYIMKPFNLEELELKVDRAIEHRRLLAHLQVYDRETVTPTFDNIIGESKAMQSVFRSIEKVARSNASILVLGETGVGKELIAAALHQNSSRQDRPFVKMNCAALHENLLESELFGHERGSFTGADRQRIGRFELANEGTIFLDEIGNMSSSTQAKVLRVLQEREFERLGGTRTLKVDVRVVAATNRDLEEAIRNGEFREDLLYRLNVVTIIVPPLRERPEDILPLAKHFIDLFSRELKKDLRGMDSGAVRRLQRHTWPGNIRELENTMERAVLMSESRYIRQEDLQLAGLNGEQQNGTVQLRLPPGGVPLEDLERQAIIEALRINHWVQKDAAKFLGISSRVMNYKVAKYEIKNERWSKNRLAG
jgi:DNA-binding NtrC family response regulator